MKNLGWMLGLVLILGATLTSAFAADADLNGVYLSSCQMAGSGTLAHSVQKYLILDLDQKFIHEGRLEFATTDCSGKPNPFTSFKYVSDYTSYGMTITEIKSENNLVTIQAKNPNAYSASTLTATYQFQIMTNEAGVPTMYHFMRMAHTQVINGEVVNMGADAQMIMYVDQKPLSYLRNLQ